MRVWNVYNLILSDINTYKNFWENTKVLFKNIFISLYIINQKIPRKIRRIKLEVRIFFRYKFIEFKMNTVKQNQFENTKRR